MKRAMRVAAVATAIGSVMACGSPAAPEPAANIAGSYNLTITASPTCSASLPPETRVLKYIANVTQTGAAFNVSLLAHVIFTSAVTTGTVSGQTVTFSTLSFKETTTGGGIALTATGTANVAADGSITGTASGTLQTPSGATCTASDHQVQLVKR